MKNITKLLMTLALFGSLEITALEKPESASINPETAALQKDVDAAKRAGTLGPIATRARELETKRLKDRYLQLGLKPNKTPAEQEEFRELTAELKARVGTAIDWLINN